MESTGNTKRRAAFFVGVSLVLIAGYFLIVLVIGGKAEDVCRAPDMTIQLREDGLLSYTFIRKGTVRLNFAALLPFPDSKSDQPLPDETFFDIEAEERGTLCLKPYGHSDGDSDGVWTIGALIVDYTRENDTDDPSNNISPCPFLFVMNSTGAISDIRFSASIPESEQKHVLGILYEMQFILPSSPVCSWQTSQSDTLGDYTASYTIAERDEDTTMRIAKVITDYTNNELAKTRFSPAAIAARIIVEHDHAEAVIESDGAWLRSVTHTQKTKIVSSGRHIGESNTSFRAERSTVGRSNIVPESVIALHKAMTACVENEKARVATEQRADPSKCDGGRDVLDCVTDEERKILEDVQDLRAALDVFLKKMEPDDYMEKRQAEMFLVNFLKLHPNEAFGVIDFIDNRAMNTLTDREELALWNAIVLAGHHEAQEAILAAVTSSTFTPQTRMTAALHLFNLTNPEPFLVDSLWKMQGTGSVTEDPNELQIRHTALFALGSIAGNEKIDEGVRSLIIVRLTERLESASEPAETVNTLLAMGNSRRPEFLDQAESYLSHPDTDIRCGAYSALSKLDDPRAFDMIVKNFQKENTTHVKAAILRSVGDMPPSEAIMAFYRTEATYGTDNNLLSPIARSLTRNIGAFPENKQALKVIIAKKPSGQVLKEIYRHISPDYLK